MGVCKTTETLPEESQAFSALNVGPPKAARSGYCVVGLSNPGKPGPRIGRGTSRCRDRKASAPTTRARLFVEDCCSLQLFNWYCRYDVLACRLQSPAGVRGCEPVVPERVNPVLASRRESFPPRAGGCSRDSTSRSERLGGERLRAALPGAYDPPRIAQSSEDDRTIAVYRYSPGGGFAGVHPGGESAEASPAAQPLGPVLHSTRYSSAPVWPPSDAVAISQGREVRPGKDILGVNEAVQLLNRTRAKNIDAG